MAYIGKTPTVGNFQVCDAIAVVNGQAAYTLQVGGVNVAPESANHMLVSLNGILQKPGSSFTISGSTMTFASNLATGDVIDFVQILGNVLDLGTPSDNTVTAAKLNNDIISGQTELASEPADTDEFLVSDAGTIKRIDYSLIKGGGITEADQWRLTADLNSNADPISSNLERVDDATFAKIGTGMSVSSGVWTFPTTGLYDVRYNYTGECNGDGYNVYMSVSSDGGSNWDLVATSHVGDSGGYNIDGSSGSFVNVGSTSSDKVKFYTSSMAGNNNTRMYGDSGANQSFFTFIRLGDDQ